MYNIYLFIIGSAIGSFLNVLIDRLSNGESINGRSRCDYCHHKLSWLDLIPIVSFVLLKGKCRYCHKKLSLQYPLVEILTGITYVFVFNLKFPTFHDYLIFNIQFIKFLVVLGISSCLIVIFFSDMKYQLISDYMLFALFIFSVSYQILNIHTVEQWVFFIVSGLIVTLPIFLIYFFSKERAMGLGDVFLSVIIGFLLGWKEGLVALYISFITGAIFGIILLILRKKKIKSKIAFGPFIVIGTVMMFFYGEKILQIIQKIYRF